MNRNDPQISQISADLRKEMTAPTHLRKSAKSADRFNLPPREIEVHIEELVLHGFDPNARWPVGDALEGELRELLSARGLPATWQSSPEKLDAGTIRLTNPARLGAQIAAAVHRGGEQ